MPGSVPAAIVDAINQAQAATMSPQVAQSSGAGKAYHMVAQAAAIAIQDAADALRNTHNIATAAAGAAMTQFLATGDARYLDALPHAQALTEKGIQDFAAIAAAAAETVKEFPSG
jgi:hypothetical protein